MTSAQTTRLEGISMEEGEEGLPYREDFWEGGKKRYHSHTRHVTKSQPHISTRRYILWSFALHSPSSDRPGALCGRTGRSAADRVTDRERLL